MLKGNDLIALGLKPGKDFAMILEKSKGFATRDEAIEFAKTFLFEEKPKERSPGIPENSVLQWLLDDPEKVWKEERNFKWGWRGPSFMLGSRHLLPPFLEGRQPEPTNSEIRRLLENRAVLINGFAPPANACMDNQWPIWQLIFFPNGNRRVTMIDDPKPADANPWFDCDGHLLTGTDEEKAEHEAFLKSLEESENG